MNSLLLSAKNQPKINNSQFPIQLRIELFRDLKANEFKIQIDKDMKFSELITYIYGNITSDKIQNDKFLFKYYIQNQEINEREEKKMSELNLGNESVLQVTMAEAAHFKFNIITKCKTFQFKLKCAQTTQSMDLENLIKERIFELSGLKAKVDYVDKLIYQVRQTIDPNQVNLSLADLIMENSTIDVILALINKDKN